MSDARIIAVPTDCECCEPGLAVVRRVRNECGPRCHCCWEAVLAHLGWSRDFSYVTTGGRHPALVVSVDKSWLKWGYMEFQELPRMAREWLSAGSWATYYMDGVFYARGAVGDCVRSDGPTVVFVEGQLVGSRFRDLLELLAGDEGSKAVFDEEVVALRKKLVLRCGHELGK